MLLYTTGTVSVQRVDMRAPGVAPRTQNLYTLPPGEAVHALATALTLSPTGHEGGPWASGPCPPPLLVLATSMHILVLDVRRAGQGPLMAWRHSLAHQPPTLLSLHLAVAPSTHNSTGASSYAAAATPGAAPPRVQLRGSAGQGGGQGVWGGAGSSEELNGLSADPGCSRHDATQVSTLHVRGGARLWQVWGE